MCLAATLGFTGELPADHVFVLTTESEAAAAVRIGAGTALRERAGPLESLRPCFARTQVWLQAGKYVAALAGGLPRVNAWSIARQAGDQTPDRTQRLLNHASWDEMAAMERRAPVRGRRAGRGRPAEPEGGRDDGGGAG